MEELKDENISQNNQKKSNRPLRYVLTSLTVLFLVLIALSLFKSDSVSGVKNGITTVLMPMQNGVNRAGSALAEAVTNVKALKKAEDENKELKAQIEELQLEITNMQQDTYEIDEFKELIDLHDAYDKYNMVGANVIAKDTGNWFHSFTIDKGSADGMKEDMAVLAQGGLAGIITSVNKHSSKVMSIIDDESNITGMSMSTKESCMVSGDLELYDQGRVRIMYVNKDSSIASGDKIVTSKISTKYVKGLLIGYVDELETDSNNMTKSGTLIPAVDFSNLDVVLVITNLKDTGDEEG